MASRTMQDLGQRQVPLHRRTSQMTQPPLENNAGAMADVQMPTVRLFVYGTLKRGYWNHYPYCGDALFIQEATVSGRLYELPSGIPVLGVPAEDVLEVGTGNACVDGRLCHERHTKGLQLGAPGEWDTIRGELIMLPSPEQCLPAIDRLEGFSPEGPCGYRRVLVPAHGAGQIVPAWCYAMGDMPRKHLRRLGESWSLLDQWWQPTQDKRS